MQGRAVPLWRRWRVSLPMRGSGLRGRMTISYVAVTLGSVLSFLLLVTLTTGVLAAFFSDSSGNGNFLTVLQQQARSYALVAGLQAQGMALDPQTSFIPGQALSITLPDQQYQVYNVSAPYISATSPDPASIPVALLITPEGRLLASSYTSRYPAGMDIAALLPAQRQAISQALAGRSSSGTEHLSSAPLDYAAEPVLGKDGQPIGAIFCRLLNPNRIVFFRGWKAPC